MALATLWPVLRTPLTLLVLGAVALAVASPAFASSSAVGDCSAHGALTQHYSVAQLRTALATMPADLQEYTNCYNVIQNQLLSQIPGHHTSGKDSPSSSDSSFLSTPLLIALIVVVAGGGAFAGVAIQRRGQPPSDR